MSSATRYAHVVHGAAAFVVMGLSIYLLAMVMVLMPTRITWPWSASPTEPQCTWGAMRVARGEPLYTDYRTMRPSVPLVYGALTYIVPGITARALYGDPDLNQVNAVGRAFAAAGFVATLLLAALLARQRKAPWWLAVLPLAWFPFLGEWSGKFMPDFPALAFSLLGWWLLGSPTNWQGRRWWLKASLGCIAWLVAFHLKPIVLVGPLAAGAEALYIGRTPGAPWRPLVGRLAGVAGILFTLTLGSALSLHVATGGLWTLNQVTSATHTPWTHTEILLILTLVKESHVLLILPLVAMLQWRKTPVAAAVLLNWIVANALMFKMGANVNYYAGTLVASGVLLAVSWKDLRFSATPRASVALTVGLLGLSLYLVQRVPDARRLFHETPAITEVQASVALKALERHAPAETTLCVSPYFGLRYRLPTPYLDGFHALLLEHKGLTSFNGIGTRLGLKEYKAILADHQSLGQIPSSMRKPIYAGYRKADQVGPFLVLVPK